MDIGQAGREPINQRARQHMHSLVLTGSEQPSWRVDVVARRDGYLGQFRRCWQCRRWFQGRAELHLLGHEESSDNR